MTTVKDIDTTGATDVSAPLQALINSIPAKGVLDFPCYTRYRCESTINWPKQITVNGNQSVVYATSAGSSNRSTFTVPGPGITINGLIAQGSKALGAGYDSAFEGQHGFNLSDAKDLQLIDCDARDVRGDFVYVNRTNRALIKDFTGVRSGRAWCSIIAGNDVTWDNPALNDAGRSGFNFEPHNATNVTDLFTVQGGVFGWHQLNFIAMYGSEDAIVNRVTFKDGVHHTSGMSVMVQGSPTKDVWTRTNLSFLNNKSDLALGNPAMAAMTFRNSRYVKIIDNVQPMGPGRNMRMASFTRCADYTVTGNTGVNLTGQFLVTV